MPLLRQRWNAEPGARSRASSGPMRPCDGGSPTLRWTRRTGCVSRGRIAGSTCGRRTRSRSSGSSPKRRRMRRRGNSWTRDGVYVRHRRLHRGAAGGPAPARWAAPPRVPRLRLGRPRARRGRSNRGAQGAREAQRAREELGKKLPAGRTGIAHTRWATHGAPTTVNAHPHTDCGGTLALIHNGIIENAGALRTALGKRGHVFRSETDTEVLAHLVEDLLSAGNPLVEAVAGALHQVEGTYGIAVVSTKEPDTIVAARHGSPLLVAIGSGENFVASDASAVLSHTRSVVYLDDGEIAVVRPQEYRILDLRTVEKEKTVTRVDWDLATIERGGYAHFMLKEIMEQPESVRNTLRGRLLEEDGTA